MNFLIIIPAILILYMVYKFSKYMYLNMLVLKYQLKFGTLKDKLFRVYISGKMKDKVYKELDFLIIRTTILLENIDFENNIPELPYKIDNNVIYQEYIVLIEEFLLKKHNIFFIYDYNKIKNTIKKHIQSCIN